MAIQIIAVGDLHLRKTAPAMRTDDYFATLERKLDFIFETADEYEVHDIIMPGDIFDRADAPHGLVEWAIKKFQASEKTFYFVYGQHDLRYHTSDKANSPLGVLVAALKKKAYVLDAEGLTIGEFCTKIKNIVNLKGVSWGEEIPVFDDELPADYRTNILVIHRPITIEQLPWDSPDLLTADQLMEACPSANLFISGDNHTSFASKGHDQLVLNMGSVLRSSIAQVDHKPAIALLTIDKTIKYEIIRIPMRRNVFDTEKAEEAAKKEEQLTAFVESLQREYNPELDFKRNLIQASKTCPKGVKNIFEEIFT